MITILLAPFVFILAVYASIWFVHRNRTGWKRDPWTLHPSSRIGQAMDKGGGRWMHWKGDGSDFLTWKLPR